MNTDPDRRDPNATAPVPVRATTERRTFKPWWLLSLLPPLLLIPYCSHRNATRAANGSNLPIASTTPADSTIVSGTPGTPAAAAVTPTSTANPGILNTGDAPTRGGR